MHHATMRATKRQLTLCTGIVRSGSTWSFNVCRRLAMMAAERRGEPFTSMYVNDVELDQVVAGYLDVLAGPTVFKAHVIGPATMSAIWDGRARAVCTYRDPRDCVASDLTFRDAPFEQVVRRVNNNLSYLGYVRAAPDALLVRYEDMMADPLREVGRIAAYMGVDADVAELQRIHAQTDLPTARAIAAGLPHRPAEGLLWSESRRVCPETQLHENHIHSGRCGRWREELTTDQQRRLTDVFHPWLVELCYEPAAGREAD